MIVPTGINALTSVTVHVYLASSLDSGSVASGYRFTFNLAFARNDNCHQHEMSLSANLHSQHGPYALVTGASSGIGAEFARQLAAGGLNLVITARRASRLEELSKSIKYKHREVDIRIIIADLTKDEDLQKVVTETEELEIGLLVNNAGLECFGSFFLDELERHRNVTKLNAMAPMELTHHFAKKMMERRRGGIIMVSSINSYPMPYNSTYSATKAYLSNLGMILNYELKPFGVDVLVMEPGATDTEMYDRAMTLSSGDVMKLSGPRMKVEDSVKMTLSQLGKVDVYTPGLGIRTVMAIAKILPRWMTFAVVGKQFEEVFGSDRVLKP